MEIYDLLRWEQGAWVAARKIPRIPLDFARLGWIVGVGKRHYMADMIGHRLIQDSSAADTHLTSDPIDLSQAGEWRHAEVTFLRVRSECEDLGMIS